MATINEMRQVATQIENETQVGGNTAGRVGGLFNDIVDKLEDNETDINIVKRVEITYKQCQIPNKYINDTNVGSALSLQSNNDYGVFYFFVRKGQSFAVSSTYVAPSASRLYIFHLDEDLDIVQRYENVVVGTTTYTATEDCIVVGTLYGNDSVQYTGIQKAYLVNGKMNEVGLTGANIIQHLKDLEADIDNDITNLNTEVGSLEDEVFGTPSVSNLPLSNDGVLNANGTISLYEDWYNSDYFAVDSAKQYTYNGSIYGGGNILYYDSAKNLLGACSNIPVNYADRTNPVELNDMPSNAAYIRVSGYDISACFITESDSLRPKVENIEERIDNLIKPQGIIEPVFGATLANPVRIKLLGDSITQGWGGSNFDQDGAEIYPLGEGWQTHRNLHGYCWANMMRDYLETKYHCTVVNNAITGTSTRNIVTRLDDFIDAADDIVICAYGTNNRNNYDGNNTEWNSFVPDLFTIVNYCKERNKTIILVANVPASSANEQSTDNGHAKSAHMNDVHDAVLYVAESTGVECVDMYDAFNDYCINTNTPLGALLGDGLHPNDNGYDVYYSLIMPRIGVAIESVSESGGVIDGNSTTIKVRRNTAAGFTSSNPVLADGELGFETDRKRYKMGDGVTAWNSLEYRSEELDETPTQGSTNGVTSGGLYNVCYSVSQQPKGAIYSNGSVEYNGETLTQNNKIINSSNAWAESKQSNRYAKSVNIPVTPGSQVKIVGNTNHGSIYALLKSDTQIGTAVDFCENHATRVVLSASQEVTITIPSDCTLLYCFINTYAGDIYFPAYLGISNNNSPSEAVGEINKEFYGGAPKSLDLSSYPTRQNFINSSNTWNSNWSAYRYGQYVHVLVPTQEGMQYIIYTTTKLCIYAFLTGDEFYGTPSFVSGYEQRYQIAAGEQRLITIPSGCNYLYLYKCSPIEDFLTPTTVVQLTGTDGLLDEKPQFRSMYNRGVMMGDSISAGVCSYIKTNDERWNDFFPYEQISDHIGKLLGIPFDNVAKRGSGYVADTRNINNAWEQAQETDYSVYDVVVMMYGVNDYIQHFELGDPDVEAVNTVAGNMQRVFNKIMTDNPNCKILCVGSYNCWGQVSSGGDYTANDYYGDATTDYALGYQISGHTLRDYLDLQKTMCEKYHVQFYCLADASVVNSMNIKYALADGLHPTIEMRKYIAQEIAKQLM